MRKRHAINPNRVEDLERWLRRNGVSSFLQGNHLRRLLFGALALATLFAGVLAFEQFTDWAIENEAVPDETILVVLVVLLGLYVLLFYRLFAASAFLGFGVRFGMRVVWRGRNGMVHVLPLLLVAVTLSFFTGELWQSVGQIMGFRLVVALAVVGVLGILALLRRAKGELATHLAVIESDDEPDPIPAGFGCCDNLPRYKPPLRKRERFNLMLLSVAGQAMVAISVGLVVMGFFLLFSFIVVEPSSVTAWGGKPARAYLTMHLGGDVFVLTSQATRVAGFLGMFSAVYFVVTANSDSDLNEALATGTGAHIREVLAVRALYRGALCAAGVEAEQTATLPTGDDADHHEPETLHANGTGSAVSADKLPESDRS